MIFSSQEIPISRRQYPFPVSKWTIIRRMDWNDKVIFLTGASSGIGEGLALAMAERGAVLGLVARRREQLENLASECEAKGAKAVIFPCDVTDAAAIQAAADAMRLEFGHIDILIANAGIGG